MYTSAFVSQQVDWAGKILSDKALRSGESDIVISRLHEGSAFLMQ